jgi:leucyl aminopeptidase
MPDARVTADATPVSAVLDVRTAPPDTAATVLELPDAPNDIRVKAGKLVRDLPAGEGSFAVEGLDGARLSAFVEGLVLGAYRFTQASARSTKPTVVRLCGATDDAALERGRRSAAATVWARDLANERAAKTPAWLAQQATKELAPLGVDVLEHDVAWLTEHGFGGVLAVGNGSSAPPRLIEASWRPRGARAGVHLVLVGKGITYDTGGLNRKVGDGMRTMYTDMAGGAAVLGALRMIAGERVPVRVTALVPTAENAFGAASYRPGDVVRHVGGRTSEIQNTDAEGRLVLADAIGYAVARLKPTAIVDLATLTGAMKVALGTRLGGLFANTDPLAGQLLVAGEESGEQLWRLPLTPEYEPLLGSDIADATNAPGNPGGITAALFLQHFAGRVPWAHLDIAGPARSGAENGMTTRGATGFGARLLHAWVAALA